MKIIDIHTHGIGGYDTRMANEVDILKMAEIHASCGISEIIPTIYPDTIRVMRENMTAVRRAMETSSTIRGVHLEGPFLNPQNCGALNAASFIEPAEYILREILDGFEDIVRIITIAPEIEGATKIIKKISDMGIVVSMGHSDATYAEAEAGFNAGARGITHIFNAMRGIHHREPGIAGFGLLNRAIYIEVIADPYHLHSKTLELIFKTKNPERIIIVSDSVKGTPSPSPLSSPPPFNSLPLQGGEIEPAPTLKQIQGFRGWGWGEGKGEGGFQVKKGIVDDSKRLQGGSMTIVESSNRLIEIGFDGEVIKRCITENPAAYLSSMAL